MVMSVSGVRTWLRTYSQMSQACHLPQYEEPRGCTDCALPGTVSTLTLFWSTGRPSKVYAHRSSSPHILCLCTDLCWNDHTLLNIVQFHQYPSYQVPAVVVFDDYDVLRQGGGAGGHPRRPPRIQYSGVACLVGSCCRTFILTGHPLRLHWDFLLFFGFLSCCFGFLGFLDDLFWISQ